MPEYPKIKITKIFYNLLDINKTYTSQIKGIYPKNLDDDEKKNILLFVKLYNDLLNKCWKMNILNDKNIKYISRLQRNLNKIETVLK